MCCRTLRAVTASCPFTFLSVAVRELPFSALRTLRFGAYWEGDPQIGGRGLEPLIAKGVSSQSFYLNYRLSPQRRDSNP